MSAALAAANDGGEIWIMDSGNFNLSTLVITKSVSIEALPGAIASIFALNGPAVNIATAGVRVSLRNLVIKALAGQGSTSGVVATNGSSLTIEKCTIADMPDTGISVNTAMQVTVVDTTVRNNVNNGINLDGGVKATMARILVTGNAFGIVTSSGATTFDVRDSVISNNAGTGIAIGSSGATTAAVVGTQLTGNNIGLFASGLNNKVLMTGNLVANNSTFGVGASNSATIALTDNSVSGNGTGISNVGGGVFTTTSNTVLLNTTADTSGTISPIGKR